MRKICIGCNNTFNGRNRDKYCSKECYLNYIVLPMINCEICNKTFTPRYKGRKYCSMRCRNTSMLGEGNAFYKKHHKLEDKKIMSELKKGKELSTEHRKKLSDAHKWVVGENNPFYGRKHTEKTKELWKQYRPKPNTPINSNTEPERIIKQLLETNGLIKEKDFYQNHWITNITHAYRADFLLVQQKTVIECDGNYWHNYPLGNDIDHVRTRELQEKGYNVLRFWESQIKNNFNEINTILLPLCQGVK